MNTLHVSRPSDWPDAGEGMCCIGAAVRGPGFCTCWKAVHDIDQAEPAPGPMGERKAMCSSCAFRPDSPERNGDSRYANASIEDLVELDDFACHQGMRRVLRWVHPSGMTVENEINAYDPPHVGSIPHKADGTPADRCAGICIQDQLMEQLESEAR